MWYRFLTLAFLLNLFIAPPVLAQQPSTPSATSTPVPLPTDEVSSTYVLPFPGILPDNPLYSLKMLRDRIVLFLINDPVKQSQFTVLQADKRLQAGLYLYRQNPQEIDLAIETIEKGENYFFQSIQHTRKVKQEGRGDFVSLVDTLQNASRKHEEELVVLEREVPKEYRSQVQAIIKRVSEYQKSIDNLVQAK